MNYSAERFRETAFSWPTGDRLFRVTLLFPPLPPYSTTVASRSEVRDPEFDRTCRRKLEVLFLRRGRWASNECRREDLYRKF